MQAAAGVYAACLADVGCVEAFRGERCCCVGVVDGAYFVA